MAQFEGGQNGSAVQNFRPLSIRLHRSEMLCRRLYNSHKTLQYQYFKWE